MTKKQTSKAKRAAMMKKLREADMTVTELALERSKSYRGYEIETLKGGTAFVRRIAIKKASKHAAVIYDLGEFPSVEVAKSRIDKAAKKFGRDITEYSALDGVPLSVKAPPTKPTNGVKKTPQKAATTKSQGNLNEMLKEKGLWQKGMQFLTSDEKQLFIDGKRGAQKVLDIKMKSIADKARK